MEIYKTRHQRKRESEVIVSQAGLINKPVIALNSTMVLLGESRNKIKLINEIHPQRMAVRLRMSPYI